MENRSESSSARITRPQSQSSQLNLRRKSRNVAQLGQLVEMNTHYLAGDFVFHGNYCGLGGNRAGDGSVIDQCDACCKTHDACYSDLLQTWKRGGVVESPFEIERDIFNRLLHTQEPRKCVPYTDIYMISGSQQCLNFGGICSRKACECDRSFANCLRYAKNCKIRSGRRNHYAG